MLLLYILFGYLVISVIFALYQFYKVKRAVLFDIGFQSWLIVLQASFLSGALWPIHLYNWILRKVKE